MADTTKLYASALVPEFRQVLHDWPEGELRITTTQQWFGREMLPLVPWAMERDQGTHFYGVGNAAVDTSVQHGCNQYTWTQLEKIVKGGWLEEVKVAGGDIREWLKANYPDQYVVPSWYRPPGQGRVTGAFKVYIRTDRPCSLYKRSDRPNNEDSHQKRQDAYRKKYGWPMGVHSHWGYIEDNNPIQQLKLARQRLAPIEDWRARQWFDVQYSLPIDGPTMLGNLRKCLESVFGWENSDGPRWLGLKEIPWLQTPAGIELLLATMMVEPVFTEKGRFDGFNLIEPGVAYTRYCDITKANDHEEDSLLARWKAFTAERRRHASTNDDSA